MTLLCDRLKRILDENPPLSQSELGQKAGVSKSVVNQWMDGKIKSMNIDAALTLEEAMGYNHIWLMTGRGEPKVRIAQASDDKVTNIRAQLVYLEPEELEIITNYREATITGAAAIKSTAATVSKRQRAEIVREY